MFINPYSQNQLVGNHPSQPVISGDLLLGASSSSRDGSLCQPRLFLCGQIRGSTLGVLGHEAICHSGTEGARTQTKPHRKCGLSLGEALGSPLTNLKYGSISHVVYEVRQCCAIRRGPLHERLGLTPSHVVP